jgi:protein translocase SecG subunit
LYNGSVTFMAHILPYIQIVLSLLLIGGVLLQRSEAGLGSAFGGDGMSVSHNTRRGFEKTLFTATIVIAILFAASAFASLYLGR